MDEANGVLAQPVHIRPMQDSELVRIGAGQTPIQGQTNVQGQTHQFIPCLRFLRLVRSTWASARSPGRTRCLPAVSVCNSDGTHYPIPRPAVPMISRSPVLRLCRIEIEKARQISAQC